MVFCTKIYMYMLYKAEPPTFISKPQSVVKVAEGQDITIVCGVYGAPKPVVTWSKDGEEVQEGSRFSINTQGKIVGNLTIKVGCVISLCFYLCATNMIHVTSNYLHREIFHQLN